MLVALLPSILQQTPFALLELMVDWCQKLGRSVDVENAQIEGKMASNLLLHF